MGEKMNRKWEQDLIRDIRFNDSRDDIDCPFNGCMIQEPNAKRADHIEFSLENHEALQKAISFCDNKPKNFLEIGVHRNEDKSSTNTLIKNLPENGIYLGVDVNDKSYLNDEKKGIHTIQTSSSNYNDIILKLKSIGVLKLDFIFIDGWHSINQVLDDWEYTNILSDGGVVAFHDTSYHPGPNRFIYSLNKEKWMVFENLCPQDYGLGFCKKKN